MAHLTSALGGGKPRVAPLKSRTMTLDQLQRRVLKVLKQTRQQFGRPHWAAGGLTDKEFVDKVLNALDHDIRTDRITLQDAA